MKFYKVAIIFLVCMLLISWGISFNRLNYANNIIDDGQKRISNLHEDIKERDTVILNQLEYYIFLQAILNNNNIEFDLYNYFVDNYINVN